MPFFKRDEKTLKRDLEIYRIFHEITPNHSRLDQETQSRGLTINLLHKMQEMSLIELNQHFDEYVRGTMNAVHKYQWNRRMGMEIAGTVDWFIQNINPSNENQKLLTKQLIEFVVGRVPLYTKQIDKWQNFLDKKFPNNKIKLEQKPFSQKKFNKNKER